MKEQPKSLGQIAFEAFMDDAKFKWADSTCKERWERAAAAVAALAALKQPDPLSKQLDAMQKERG